MATSSHRPRVACEIASDRVVAARLDAREPRLELYTTRRLEPGVVAPGLTGHNVLKSEQLRDGISAAMASVGGGRSKDAIVVLPDASVRVLLLDFDTLPEKREDAAGIIRFRVKKSLPFDAEHAALSFDSRRSNGTVKVVAALCPNSVLNEYESAFRSAGLVPGVVIPSVLATLGLVNADRPTMLVKVDPQTTTVAIVDRDELLLVRTLERTGEANAQSLLDSIHPSMVFYEDTFNSRIETILIAGLTDVNGLAQALQAETGVRTTDMSSIAGLPEAQVALAGVAGALLG